MKKYQIIYADPPWQYAFSGTRTNDVDDYPTMDKDSICELPIISLAEQDAILLMWVIFPKLEWSFDVMRAWGFEYVTNAFTWIKQNKTGDGLFYGMGYYTRSNTEICLMGKRGKGLPTLDHAVHSVVEAPVSKHSRKPPIIKKYIEDLFGVDRSRIELFARKPDQLFDADGFDGWDVWGNEVDSDIELK